MIKSASIKYALWLGSAFAFVPLAIMFHFDRIDLLALVAFAFGIVLVVGTLFRHNRCGGPDDERMRKIAAFAMRNSWASGVVLMSLLLVLTYFSWGHVLSGIQVGSLAIMLMLAAFDAWYAYYSLKGDVE